MDYYMSYLLAIFWVVYLGSLGTLLVAFPKMKIEIVEMSKDTVFQFIFGISAMLVGLFHLVFHNIWTFDFRGVITLLGWAAVAKSAILIVIPTAHFFSERFVNHRLFNFWIAGMFLIAGFLLFSLITSIPKLNMGVL